MARIPSMNNLSSATGAAFLRQCRAATSAASRSNPSASFSTASRSLPRRAHPTSSITRPLAQSKSTARAQAFINSSRSFSSTTPTSATAVLQNPRTDDDGAEMLISISDRAAKRLSQIGAPNPKSGSSSPQHLRVTVTSGGCHGFQYLMALEPFEKIDSEEDTVFASVDESSATPQSSEGKVQAKVVMDEPSLELLKGSTVDFTTELIGSQFKIVGNPRAKSSCGCGTSFDVE